MSVGVGSGGGQEDRYRPPVGVGGSGRFRAAGADGRCDRYALSGGAGGSSSGPHRPSGGSRYPSFGRYCGRCCGRCVWLAVERVWASAAQRWGVLGSAKAAPTGRRRQAAWVQCAGRGWGRGRRVGRVAQAHTGGRPPLWSGRASRSPPGRPNRRVVGVATGWWKRRSWGKSGALRGFFSIFGCLGRGGLLRMGGLCAGLFASCRVCVLSRIILSRVCRRHRCCVRVVAAPRVPALLAARGVGLRTLPVQADVGRPLQPMRRWQWYQAPTVRD